MLGQSIAAGTSIDRTLGATSRYLAVGQEAVVGDRRIRGEVVVLLPQVRWPSDSAGPSYPNPSPSPDVGHVRAGRGRAVSLAARLGHAARPPWLVPPALLSAIRSCQSHRSYQPH